MPSRPLSEREKAIWLNVKNRYPGFVRVVHDTYWQLVDVAKLEAGSLAFAGALLEQVPTHEIEITDTSQSGSSLTPQFSSEVEQISKWVKGVRDYHALIEAMISGDVALPIGTESDSNYATERAIQLERIKELEREISVRSATDAEVPELFLDENQKRLNTLYKMILGIALDKYRYEYKVRSGAVRGIKGSLERHEIALDEGPILDVLEKAYEHAARVDNFYMRRKAGGSKNERSNSSIHDPMRKE